MSEEIERSTSMLSEKQLEYEWNINEYTNCLEPDLVDEGDGDAAKRIWIKGAHFAQKALLEKAAGSFEEYASGLDYENDGSYGYPIAEHAWTASRLSLLAEMESKDAKIRELEARLAYSESRLVERIAQKEHFEQKLAVCEEKLKVTVEALEWIAKTDTASVVHGPDTLWLTNWRNTRKQAATYALKKINGDTAEGDTK